jgi:hypothetical protein
MYAYVGGGMNGRCGAATHVVQHFNMIGGFKIGKAHVLAANQNSNHGTTVVT